MSGVLAPLLLLMLIAPVLAIAAGERTLPAPTTAVQRASLRRRSSTSVLGVVVLACARTLVPVAGLRAMPLASASGQGTGPALALAGIGALVGLAAVPAGLVMVVFPEVIARRSDAADRPVPGIEVGGHGPAAAQGVS